MTKKIKGDLDVSLNTTSYGKNTIRDINNIAADQSGEIDISYYPKSYVDNLISMLPISRIGSMDYLPLNINGSFEGATTIADDKVLPVLLESDGTLVYLRAGTNGSTKGFYYCYQKNARQVSNTFNPILTNSTYIPTYFDSTRTLVSFVGSKADEVLFMKILSSNVPKYAIALTNGTFNIVSHQYLEFDTSLIDSAYPQYAHIVGNYVYIWCLDSLDNANPLAISAYSILISDVVSGSTASLTRVTGINGKNLYGDTNPISNSIILAPKLVSTVGTEKPFALLTTGVDVSLYTLYNDGVIQADSDANGNIRVAVFCVLRAYTSQTSSPSSTWGVSFVFNPINNSYTIDTTAVAPITFNSPDPSQILITNPFLVNMENINGYTSIDQGQCPTLYQTVDGIVFSTIARYITSPAHKLSTGKINNFVDLYSSLNLTTRTLSNTFFTFINPVYGSAVGENLLNPTVLSASKIMLSCSGTESGIYHDFNSKAYADIGTTTTYNYTSAITGDTLNGFAPQANRGFLTNSNYQYNGTITLIAADGTISTYGSSFIEGVTKPANNLLNPNTMQYDSTIYTLSSNTMLTDLKNAILAANGGYGTIVNSKIVLYYVPDNSLSSSIACVSLLNDTGASYVIISEISTTISGTTITTLTNISNRLIHSNTGIVSIDTSFLDRMAGLVIAKYTDFTYIGIPALFNMNLVGNASFRSVIGKIDNSTKLITGNLTSIGGNYLSIGQSYEVGAIPNVGFGLFKYGDITDYQTKLIFSNFGTTSAQMDALLADPNSAPISNIVVASQEVAQGFIVYFTQDVPVLIAGKYGIIKSTNIDLSTIDSSPANKTFYIYAINVSSVLQYQISTTLLSEELTRMFIGTIITGASGISSISTEKVTRFLTYRPSVTKRGSAIPASIGVPSGTGTRWH